MAAPAPFHLQKLCVFLAFSKRVAPERPSIANVLTLFCWWFWSGRETCLVFVEQLVKTDPFAQVQWCISELSWKSFHCALKLFFFFFFHVAVHAHMVGDLREFILLPKTKDYFKFLHQKKEKRWEYTYATMCINIFAIIVLSASWLYVEKKSVYTC